MGLEEGTRRFCLRRVNPFRGIVAVVRTPAGRALSFNGRDRQIQVLAHPPRGLWSRGGHQESLRYFRSGVWSEEQGVSQVPLADLPPLTLRTEWSEAADRALIGDYVAWMAPYLLTLPGLSDQWRRTLEPQAARSALVVDALWRL